MNIVFICGSLEPGCDGVGDYTRRLAGELTRLGYTIAIVALNDPAVKGIVTGTQSEGGANLPVLRIPAGIATNERMQAVERWINKFEPEWMSLQYVPYAFDKRGLPFSLINELKKILNNRRLHVMFHENWLGAEQGSGFKQTLAGYLQKKIVQKLNKSLRPVVVHTHLPANQAELKAEKILAKPLPLFSNIPVAFLHEEINEENIIRLGFFSQVQISTAVISFLVLLKKEAEKNNLGFEILLIGGNAEKMQRAVRVIENAEGMHGCVKYTGFLNAQEISAAIQTCTLGITPVPRHALGKSGSVAAFLAHGIPVASPNVHYRYKPANIGFFSVGLCAAIITEPKLHLLQPARIAAIAAIKETNLSVIAKKYLSDLQQAAHV